MATLTKTRKLIEDLKDSISEASKASFISVIEAFEAGRLGPGDAALQMRLGSLGPAAATSDPQKMNQVLLCFEAEANGR